MTAEQNSEVSFQQQAALGVAPLSGWKASSEHSSNGCTSSLLLGASSEAGTPSHLPCDARRGVTLRFQRDQAKAMQRYFQQQKAAEIADRSQCACLLPPAFRVLLQSVVPYSDNQTRPHATLFTVPMM